MSENSDRKLAGVARARGSDPSTSHEGAQELERKGKGVGQRALCLRTARNRWVENPTGLGCCVLI